MRNDIRVATAACANCIWLLFVVFARHFTAQTAQAEESTLAGLLYLGGLTMPFILYWTFLSAALLTRSRMAIGLLLCLPLAIANVSAAQNGAYLISLRFGTPEGRAWGLGLLEMAALSILVLYLIQRLRIRGWSAKAAAAATAAVCYVLSFGSCVAVLLLSRP